MRGPYVLLIVVLMLAAASIAIIRSLTSNEAKKGPHLILQQSASGAVDDVIPLGAQVDDRTAAVTLEVRGLPVGMTISSGRQLGAVWRIRAADAVNATIHPPPGFSGAIDLTVELRRSDETVVDRGSVHREWLQRSSVSVTSTPTDETAQLRTNRPALHRAGAGASIESRGASVVRNVQPGARKGHTASAASAKRKRGAVRSPTHARAAHDHRYHVYGGGRRVGVDPDLDIRITLAKQYDWLN